MNRRSLLQRSALIGAFLMLPRPALALGGTAPDIGQPAPDFDLLGTSRDHSKGKRWSLNDLRGQWVVLYFYPRDFTSGCTIEAHGFQTFNDRFEAAGASVIGVSADGVDDHASFCSSEALDFLLLSDPDGTVSKAYGSWMAPYSMRHTFLLDPEGIVRERWVGVRPTGHAKEVFTRLGELQTEASV